MNEECLICTSSLEYLSADEEMECVLCHKKQYSKTRCVSMLACGQGVILLFDTSNFRIAKVLK